PENPLLNLFHRRHCCGKVAHRSFLLLGVLCVKHHFTKGEALFLYPLFPIPTPTEILHYRGFTFSFYTYD
ncbi:hypothetical protein ACTNDP_05600, partial [Paenibacillus barengoltzii]|uniref:hypothetical protein n=1 Tax=Paenibacillus barengoltzii TaxID=343517 RepID=UPI003F894092